MVKAFETIKKLESVINILKIINYGKAKKTQWNKIWFPIYDSSCNSLFIAKNNCIIVNLVSIVLALSNNSQQGSWFKPPIKQYILSIKTETLWNIRMKMKL